MRAHPRVSLRWAQGTTHLRPTLVSSLPGSCNNSQCLFQFSEKSICPNIQSFKDAKKLNASHHFHVLLQPLLISHAHCSAAAPLHFTWSYNLLAQWDQGILYTYWPLTNIFLSKLSEKLYFWDVVNIYCQPKYFYFKSSCSNLKIHIFYPNLINTKCYKLLKNVLLSVAIFYIFNNFSYFASQLYFYFNWNIVEVKYYNVCFRCTT